MVHARKEAEGWLMRLSVEQGYAYRSYLAGERRTAVFGKPTVGTPTRGGGGVTVERKTGQGIRETIFQKTRGTLK